MKYPLSNQVEANGNLTQETMPNFSSFWTASSTSKLQLSPNSSLISSHNAGLDPISHYHKDVHQ